MREHLYQGKRIDNGEWVEGYFVGANYPDYKTLIIGDMSVDTDGSANISDILSWQIYEVDPETVSEFTGLTDKHGNRVFESNIVKFTDRWDGELIGEVFYDSEMIDWRVYVPTRRDVYFLANSRNGKCEVIGNKFDNADLLEGNI